MAEQANVQTVVCAMRMAAVNFLVNPSQAEVKEAIYSALQREASAVQKRAALTEAEREVLKLILEGQFK